MTSLPEHSFAVENFRLSINVSKLLAFCVALSVMPLSQLRATHAASSDPSSPPVQPPVQRGHTYLRIQGAGGREVRQSHFPTTIKIIGGGMLDHPDRISRPLLIEQIDDHGRQWVMLERQLSRRTFRQTKGLANIQTLQILDSQPIPTGGQLLFSVANGAAVCSYAGTADADLVAFRMVADQDHQKPVFSDLQLAWRVNRQQLRLQPVDSTRLTCTNPSEGQP